LNKQFLFQFQLRTFFQLVLIK